MAKLRYGAKRYKKDSLRTSMKGFLVISGCVIVAFVLKIGLIGVDEPKPEDGTVKNVLVGALAPTPIPESELKLQKANEELEKTRRENSVLRVDLASRGDVATREVTRKNKIISVLNNNLGGKLKNKGLVVYNACVSNGIHPFLLASVAIHETGNGTSVALRDKNNVGGIMTDNDVLKYFVNLDDSIWVMAKIMRQYYIDKNLTALDEFGHKYCPIGADNDPTGLNKYWVPAVSKNYIKMLNESGGIIW